jgi:single stranded DNA-binding protein
MSAHIVIVGRIGRLGELKLTAGNNTPYLGFTVASSHWKPGRDGAEGSEVTTWYHARLFGSRAESLAKRLKIGDLVAVRGETWAESYVSTTGEARQSNEVTADAVERLTNNRVANDTRAPEQPAAAPSPAAQSSSTREEPPF